MTKKKTTTATSKKEVRKNVTNNQSHYVHFGQIFLLVVVLLAVYYFRDSLNPLIVTGLVLTYFVANTYHAYAQKRLTPERLLEYGIISLVCEFLLLNYVV